MPQLIDAPTIIEAAGSKPKRIEEFVGRVNSRHTEGQRSPDEVAAGLGRTGAEA